MDKEEAERLARAIRKAPVTWIRVSGVEQNPTTNMYEVTCECKPPQKGLFHARESWTTLLIKSPRQWIDLLTQQVYDNDTYNFGPFVPLMHLLFLK